MTKANDLESQLLLGPDSIIQKMENVKKDGLKYHINNSFTSDSEYSQFRLNGMLFSSYYYRLGQDPDLLDILDDRRKKVLEKSNERILFDGTTKVPFQRAVQHALTIFRGVSEPDGERFASSGQQPEIVYGNKSIHLDLVLINLFTSRVANLTLQGGALLTPDKLLVEFRKWLEDFCAQNELHASGKPKGSQQSFVKEILYSENQDYLLHPTGNLTQLLWSTIEKVPNDSLGALEPFYQWLKINLDASGSPLAKMAEIQIRTSMALTVDSLWLPQLVLLYTLERSERAKQVAIPHGVYQHDYVLQLTWMNRELALNPFASFLIDVLRVDYFEGTQLRIIPFEYLMGLFSRVLNEDDYEAVKKLFGRCYNNALAGSWEYYQFDFDTIDEWLGGIGPEVEARLL